MAAGASSSQGAMSMAIGQSSASPGHSSPESFDVEDDPNLQSSAHWQMNCQASPTTLSQAQKGSAPLQKRRRVTRACDECRRKKIKCDGKQPCTHCTVYSYDCTYDQPSNRRRNPAPQYIEALETRLQRAETLLRSLLPNIDLNDPNIDAAIQQRRQVGNAKDLVQNATETKPTEPTNAKDTDAKLRSMIESTGQLDLDESGHWDFHGGSSGAVFVKRMREQFGGLLGGNYPAPFLPRLPRTMPLGPMYDSPRSSMESPLETGLPNTMDLPSRGLAKALTIDALDKGCSLLRFVHQPSFYEMFDRIYDIPPENFGDNENRFLPLLYVVLAQGCMFHLDPSEDELEPTHNTYKAGIDQGLKYFRAARQMMDITDCRDIVSLQAILFMILFLQSSANLSTCYSYIGIALRSALRMGLHRNLTGNFNPIERETRRRVFWVIRKMDTYVSALLGFPRMLSDDDIDQELPIEVDDEYLTKDGVLPMPIGTTSLYAASNAHTRLMGILAKVIKYIYPTKGLEKSVQGSSTSSYVISNVKIREIEQDLSDWLDKLPMGLRPGGEGIPEVLRVQQLLRLAYAHVQMMLYRPFLHYSSPKSCSGRAVDGYSYACAAAGVSVSRNIVHITTEMKRRGLLIGAYWFTMYTTFFAILSLVYFVLNNPDKPGSQEILVDAYDGKEALKGLAQRSQAADRCSVALRTLFEKLPDRLKKRDSAAQIARKKRSAASLNAPGLRGIHSTPDLSKSEFVPSVGVARAATFPTQVQSGARKVSVENKKSQLNTISNPNLRQSFQDLVSPTSLSASGTPDSTSSGNTNPGSQYGIPQFDSNNGLPELSAMMFPSADPFAYPNQPMMEFENIKQENHGGINNRSQAPPMFLANGATAPALYDDLEGQLFGPIPPYLMQGQQPFDISGQMDIGNSMMSGLNPSDMNYHTGMTPNGEINFDGIFSGDGEDWSNIMDQRYR